MVLQINYERFDKILSDIINSCSGYKEIISHDNKKESDINAIIIDIAEKTYQQGMKDGIRALQALNADYR